MPDSEYTVEFVIVQPNSKTKYDAFWRRIGGFYNLAIPLLASLTPNEFRIKVTDQSTQDLNYNSASDIIAISFMTSHATSAYKVADEFRRQGKTVVLGGIHASALPDEAKEHADVVAIGEGELIWPKILQDFVQGNLKPYYSTTDLLTMNDLPMPRHDLMPRFSKRIGMASVQTTRGCPFACEFCSITSVFGSHFRKRPIENVIREIQQLDQKHIIMVDDNIATDQAYAAQLFKALKPLNIKWVSQTDIKIAANHELLDLAAQSGCVGLLIGLESVEQGELNNIGKSRYNAEEYSCLIKNIHNSGIMISGSFIFGLDGQGPDVFEKTINFIKKNGLAYAYLPILTPYPGTKIAQKFEKDGRIIHKNWELYDASHVVFNPSGMSPEQLESGWTWATKELASPSSFFQRIKVAPVQMKYNILLNTVNFLGSRFDSPKRKINGKFST